MKNRFLFGIFLGLLLNVGLSAMQEEVDDLAISPTDFIMNPEYMCWDNLKNPENFVSLLALYYGLTNSRYSSLNFLSIVESALEECLKLADKGFLQRALVVARSRNLPRIQNYIFKHVIEKETSSEDDSKSNYSGNPSKSDETIFSME